ncbi:FMN-linked oxidoreductase, partial [Pholiota conissans]
ITDSVHEKGSYIYLQLWALGRSAKTHILAEDGHDFVSASDIPIEEGAQAPRSLTIPEIQQYVQQYAQAAKNAVNGAGFDGVEVHCANGFLPDQFLQDVSNKRTDAYGGSIEARSKFPLEIVDAVVKAIGPERTGLRISPWGTYGSMKMADPISQFTHFISNVASSHPNLAYIHAVEPEVPGTAESNDFIRNIWAPRPFITAQGYTRETAIERADSKGDLIAFGKVYISNPDLPTRLQKDIPLTPFDVDTFYTSGHLPNTEVGYTDYPFAYEVEVQA